MTVANADNAMANLKKGTAAEHEAIEATPFAQSLALATVTRHGFRAQLQAYRWLHEALDSRLADSHDRGVTHVAVGVTKRTTWIDEDLAVLGRTPLAPAVEAATRAIVTWFTGLDGPALLGVSYVLEGSALGSAFLAMRLREHTAVAGALRYYQGHGAETARYWRAYCSLMNAVLVDPNAQAVAIGAAREMFARMGRLFEALGAERTAKSTERPPSQVGEVSLAQPE